MRLRATAILLLACAMSCMLAALACWHHSVAGPGDRPFHRGQTLSVRLAAIALALAGQTVIFAGVLPLLSRGTHRHRRTGILLGLATVASGVAAICVWALSAGR
jgi:hypothetical protein